MRRFRWSWALLVVLSATLAAAGVTVAASTTAAVAAQSTTLTARVTLSHGTSAMGELVTARIAKSAVPRGDRLVSLRLGWGDGTKRVALKSLGSTARHRYARPGRYLVTLILTDEHRRTARGSANERVYAPSGSYSGGYTVGGGEGSLTFYVSSHGSQLQDVQANISMTCSPGGASTGGWDFVIDSVVLPASGAFTATSTQADDYQGYPATLKLTFQGDIQGLSSTGQAEAAGSLKETLSYNNGTAYHCTSNKLPWSTTRDSQPAQPTTRPPSGSYSGGYFAGGGEGSLTFYVSPDRAQLQDVQANVSMTCSPGDGSTGGWGFVIDSLALPASGAFTATSTQADDYQGYPATLKLTFQGHVHGLSSSGIPRLAGSLVMTMSYNNGTAYHCTSNKLPWSTTRDSQPAQPTTRPPSGSYSGGYFAGGGEGSLTFSVASGSTQLQNVSATVGMTCAPGGGNSGEQPFVIDSVALPASGAFATTSTQDSNFEGHPATLKLTFQGHVHGLSSSGIPRLAGSLMMTMSYNNGTAYNCTSNKLPWYAIKSG